LSKSIELLIWIDFPLSSPYVYLEGIKSTFNKPALRLLLLPHVLASKTKGEPNQIGSIPSSLPNALAPLS
jgi:hypothetical protein